MPTLVKTLAKEGLNEGERVTLLNPGCDVFYPHIRRDPDGFVVGMELEGGVGWNYAPAVSVAGLRELAKKFADMVDRELVEAIAAERDRALEEVQRLNEELAQADSVLEGVDALARKGFVPRKAPGRPKQRKES